MLREPQIGLQTLKARRRATAWVMLAWRQPAGVGGQYCARQDRSTRSIKRLVLDPIQFPKAHLQLWLVHNAKDASMIQGNLAVPSGAKKKLHHRRDRIGCPATASEVPSSCRSHLRAIPSSIGTLFMQGCTCSLYYINRPQKYCSSTYAVKVRTRESTWMSSPNPFDAPPCFRPAPARNMTDMLQFGNI